MEPTLQEWHKLHKFYGGCAYQTKELAQYLKVSPRTIQRWLNGRTNPPKEKIILIKRFLIKNIREGEELLAPD